MKAWDVFLEHIEKSLGKETVDKWLRSLKVIHFDAGNLYLEGSSSFQEAWFNEHIKDEAKRSFKSESGRLIKIHFSTEKKKKTKTAPEPPPLPIEPDPIDPSAQFSNFLFEENGELIVKFFRQLMPGSFNPVYLYGPPSSGKTHLLMSTAAKLKKGGLSVFYVHAESFTQHVVSAIRSSQMQHFRSIYRNQDVLIIDDVHHFARKGATQEELFHTFNTLHTAGKQIILSSYLPPSRLDEIEPRLISRFEWGIVLETHPLPPSMMEQVILNKAQLHHLPLDCDVAPFLAGSFSTSKAIMQAVDALLLRHKENHPLTVDECTFLLRDLLDHEKGEMLTPDRILTSTSAYFGIRPDDILSKSQAKECALPRKVAMYLCRKKLTLSYVAIGKIFGRDHSTVLSSIRQVEKKGGSTEIETALEEIENQL